VEDDPEHVSMTYASFASPGVFETLGVPLLRGRDFADYDVAGGPPVAIVNKALADQAWPGEDPIGKRFSKNGPEGPWLEVVGVSTTVRYNAIEELPQSLIYEPFAQQYLAGMTLLVRAEGDPAALLPAVRTVVHDLDSGVAPVDMRTLTDIVADKLLAAKIAAALFGLFGALALVLASVGLYGVMSFVVGQRTHEIGVRVALGARRGDVVRLVLSQGLRLTVVGVGIGLVFSLAGSFALASMLYGVGAGDPLSFAGVSLLLVAVAALACYIPARRAARVDPIVALRYE
jgi:putative ABC transport system permease protein